MSSRSPSMPSLLGHAGAPDAGIDNALPSETWRRIDRPVWSAPETWLLMVPLLFYTVDGALSPNNSPMELRAAATGSQSHMHQLIQFAIAALIATFGARYWHRIRSCVQRNWVFFILPRLSIASTAWSDKPEPAIIDSVYLLVLTGFACVLHAMFTARRQMELVVFTGALALSLSLLLVIFVPSIGRDPLQDGAWRGIFGQRNVTAGISALWFASALCYQAKGPVAQCIRWTVLLLSLMFLAEGRSVTGLELLLTLVFLAVLLRVVMRFVPADRLVALSIALVCTAAAAGLVFAYKDTLLAAVGKDPTLDQRTQIWAACFRAAMHRPWLGYGYTGFWGGKSGTSALVQLEVGWPVAQAQSGYLDLFLSLGLAGMLVWAASMVVAGRNMVRSVLSRRRSLFVQWCVLMIAALLVFNVGETTLAMPYNFSWLVFLVACFGLEQEARGIKPASTAGAELLSPAGAAPDWRQNAR